MTTTTGGVQLLDYSEAEQLLRQGMTQQEVGARFGVTQGAVAAAIMRGRIKVDRHNQRALPWAVRPEHRQLAIPRMIRIATRIERGDKDIPPLLRKQGEGFLRVLEEMDAVIHYDPDVAPYFFRVPRRRGVDVGIFRNPDVP